MHLLRYSRNNRPGCVIALLLIPLIAACGSSAPEGKTIPPTATPASAEVAGTTGETTTPASPQPTLPPISEEDIAFLDRAVVNTSVVEVDKIHFVMTNKSNIWPTTITEGDFVPLDNIYEKITQNESVEEILTLNNKSYCKDSSGKWIVVVEDLDAQRVTIYATIEARQNEARGIQRTPQPIIIPTPDPSQYTRQLPLWGSVDLEYYEFGYAGEEIIEGVQTRHYIGRSKGRKLSLPPGKEDDSDTEIVGNSSMFNDDTFALWIDPVKELVSKVEHKSTFAGTALVATSYSYGCGEPTPEAPEATPTLPVLPDEMTNITTIVYSKINDPSVTLPNP